MPCPLGLIGSTAAPGQWPFHGRRKCACSESADATRKRLAVLAPSTHLSSLSSSSSRRASEHARACTSADPHKPPPLLVEPCPEPWGGICNNSMACVVASTVDGYRGTLSRAFVSTVGRLTPVELSVCATLDSNIFGFEFAKAPAERMSSSFHRRKSIPKRDWHTMAMSVSTPSRDTLLAAQDVCTVHRAPASLFTSLVPASSSASTGSDTHAIVAASTPDVAATTLDDAGIVLVNRAFDHVASSSIGQTPNLHALGTIPSTIQCVIPHDMPSLAGPVPEYVLTHLFFQYCTSAPPRSSIRQRQRQYIGACTRPCRHSCRCAARAADTRPRTLARRVRRPQRLSPEALQYPTHGIGASSRMACAGIHGRSPCCQPTHHRQRE